MTVAHDNVTESAVWTTTPDPFKFNHIPVGTPKGIMVFIMHRTSNSDQITAVTYGGVSMARIQTAALGGGEQGRSYVYFVGASIPTGEQTVSIDHTATTNDKMAFCVSVTAAADTSVIDSDIVQAVQTNPQVTLDSGADSALSYCGIWTGLPAPTDLTVITGMTNLGAGAQGDFGPNATRVDRETSVSTGTFTIGYTGGSDEQCLVALAIKEEAVAAAASFLPLSRHRAFAGLIVR